MDRQISIEALEAAMAEAIDETGNDRRLSAWVESMTDDERRESEENLRRWVDSARASLESR